MSFAKAKVYLYFILLALCVAVFLLNAVGLVRPPELIGADFHGGYVKTVALTEQFNIFDFIASLFCG